MSFRGGGGGGFRGGRGGGGGGGFGGRGGGFGGRGGGGGKFQTSFPFLTLFVSIRNTSNDDYIWTLG